MAKIDDSGNLIVTAVNDVTMQPDGATKWTFTASDLIFTGDNTQIRSNGDDDTLLRLLSGSSTLTGAGLLLYGGSHGSNPGEMYLDSIGAGSIFLRTGGGVSRWSLDSDGDFNFHNTTTEIHAASGSTNQRLCIGAGTDVTQTTGANLDIYSSDLSGDLNVLAANNGTGAVQFYTGGSLRWRVENAGNLLPGANNSLAIGSTSLQVSDVNTRIVTATDSLQIRTSNAADIFFKTSNTNRWILGSAGHLNPAANSTYDIGNSSSPTLIRAVYSTALTSVNQTLTVGTTTAHNINLNTSNTTRWVIGSSGSFVPQVTDTTDFGSTSSRVSSAYIRDLRYCDGLHSHPAGQLIIETTGVNTIRFGINSLLVWQMDTSGNLVPDGTRNLGSTVTNVSTVYANTVRRGGVGTLTVDTTDGDLILKTAGGSGRDIFLDVSTGSWNYFQSAGTTKWVMQHNTGSGDFVPNTQTSQNIGSNTAALANIHTNFVKLKNSTKASEDEIEKTADSPAGIDNDTGAAVIVRAYDGPIVFSPNVTANLGTDPTKNRGIGVFAQAIRPADENVVTYDCGRSSNRFDDGWFRSTVTANNFVPFTGLHVYEEDAGESLEKGDCVYLLNDKLKRCTASEDKRCVGVVAGNWSDRMTAKGEDPSTMSDSLVRDPVTISGDLLCVASVGDCRTAGISGTVALEGAKVCDEGGDIEDGDLLCTASGYPGHLKKQADDIVRACTVMQSREAVTFSGSPTASGIYAYFVK